MLNRRDLLGGLAAVGCAAGLGSRDIVDTHIHLYEPERPQGVPWPPSTDALLYKRHMPVDFRAAVQGLGVTRAIVVEASPWLEDNQWLLPLAEGESLIGGVVGHLEAGSAGFAAQLERFAKNPLFRGIRLGEKAIGEGVSKPAFVADLRRVTEAGLALDAIGGAGVLVSVARLTDRIPQLRVIVDHLPFTSLGDPALAELRRRPQVYAKLSGSLTGSGFRMEAADEVWEVFGPKRVIYASNWPVSNRVASYTSVLKLMQRYVAEKGAGAAEAFFSGNSRLAYRWMER